MSIDLLKNLIVTPDEFLTASGINLGNLVDDDNPSNKKERFLLLCQELLCSYIYRNFKRDAVLYYNNYMDDTQKAHFRLAIVRQGEYLIANGNIGNQSGVSDDTLSIVDRVKLNGAKIAPNAIDELNMAGNISSGKLRGNGSNISELYWLW
ncbi:MAG: hypothetical protein M0R51_14960 [Clostridia bacterium]|jgi:hypothetical protein|nr:hypothetical protein [Clostridia bacterium]MDD3086251.1 hypothetical protein [Candidatus ainarchaeum sp.]